MREKAPPRHRAQSLKRAGLALSLLFFLCACAGKTAGQMAAAGEPTVYATVAKEPDPLLLGCYFRSQPSEYKHPNSYRYCLVKRNDRYAVYYDWRDGKTFEEHKGWMPFTISGDHMRRGLPRRTASRA